MKEEFLINYMALLACILSDCSSEQAIKTILKEDYKFATLKTKRAKNCKILGQSKGVKTKVINLQTKEELIFNSGVEAGKYLGASRSVVPDYLRNNKIYKGIYKFEKVD